MCCLFAVLVFIGPRAGAMLWWLMQPQRWQAAFPSMVWPILGVIFVPWTTMMYILVHLGGITGLDWLWLAIGLIADVAWYGGAAKRKAVPNYTGQ